MTPADYRREVQSIPLKIFEEIGEHRVDVRQFEDCEGARDRNTRLPPRLRRRGDRLTSRWVRFGSWLCENGGAWKNR